MGNGRQCCRGNVLNKTSVCKIRPEKSSYLDEEQDLQEEKTNSAGQAKEKNLGKGRGGNAEVQVDNPRG